MSIVWRAMPYTCQPMTIACALTAIVPARREAQ
jgi:hypothetical protein